MFILGIETSCDDTGIAIVEADERGYLRRSTRITFNILSNIVSSQIKVHQKYGGVVPNLAAREHLKNIEPCLRQVFQKTNLKPSNIDLIAITVGPGLIPSLLIGVNFAKTLAYKWKKPIIGVNHLEGHIIAALAATNPKSKILNPKPSQTWKQIQNSKFKIQNLFPAIALVVSGGHTQLILVKKIGSPPHQKFGVGGKYKILGETRDDAAGECFDKVAKLLGLGYPGGPAISAEVEKILNPKSEIRNQVRLGNKFKIQNSKFKISLPRPMINHKNYDFSFSGLKTAVLYLLKDIKQICPIFYDRRKMGIDIIPELCCEVQQAIIDVLIEKTIRAAKEYKAKSIILSGGVAANTELRKQFKSKLQTTDYPGLAKRPVLEQVETRSGSEVGKLLKFFAPAKNLCTDNGAMIAMAGYYNKNKATKNYDKIKANANLRLS